MRQIVLDTETTGLEITQGHRIIEVGCVELVNRKLTGNHYHQYINPEREIDQGAIEVHGITLQSLSEKPVFSRVASELLDYIDGAELIIHNAPFDIGFLDSEFKLVDQTFTGIEARCQIIDTLQLARHRHPGQRNSLDALCERYDVDNSQRDLHGALLDAEILADVYLMMTGGQTSLRLANTDDKQEGRGDGFEAVKRLSSENRNLSIIYPTDSELDAHEGYMELLGERGRSMWKDKIEAP